MTTKVAAHFEDLRRRFAAGSAMTITNAQQSVESMEFMAANPNRHAKCRSAFFEIAGVNYLVWELDEQSDSFQVFVTCYTIPLGIVRLSSKPSGIIVIAGFYIDLAVLATVITAHFQSQKLSDQLPIDLTKKKRKVLLFGFSDSFGHHYWNEVSGLASAMATGLFDTLDGILLGPFDYFNLGPYMQAKGKEVWKLSAKSALMTPDNLVIYTNNVATNDARRLVQENAALQEPVFSPSTAKHAICLQIRRHRRPWINEENGMIDIIKACHQKWPGMTFFIDGHGTSKGSITNKQAEIADEAKFVAGIAEKLGPGIDLRSTIGMNINVKINTFKNVDMFAGATGSGGVMSSWILRLPTITFGPTSFYDPLIYQDDIVPEGGSMISLVPRSYIQDLNDEAMSFDVPVPRILDLIFAAMPDKG